MALITSHKERLEAQAVKRRRLLGWLRSELWTSHEIAGDVMGIRNRSAIQRTLESMSRDGLLLLDTVDLPLRPMHVIGITMDGQGAAATAGKDIANRCYERGRIGLTVADHTLDLQRLKLACLRAGWTNWYRPDTGKWGKAHRPDAIALTPSGERVAVECERTIKSPKRYAVVAGNHIGALRSGAYQRVIYVCPNAEKVRHVERLYRTLPPVSVAGERTLPGPIIDEKFSFLVYADLPKGA